MSVSLKVHNDLAAPRVLIAVQGRDGGICVFQSKTRAVGDDSVGLGGRRGGPYFLRNARTYSLTGREPLSVLMITHVSKHNDASESGFTTTPSA